MAVDRYATPGAESQNSQGKPCASLPVSVYWEVDRVLCTYGSCTFQRLNSEKVQSYIACVFTCSSKLCTMIRTFQLAGRGTPHCEASAASELSIRLGLARATENPGICYTPSHSCRRTLSWLIASGNRSTSRNTLAAAEYGSVLIPVMLTVANWDATLHGG